MKSIVTTLLAIYRPPYSQEHKYTIRMFNEEFTQFLSDIQVNYKNLIVLGDFNVHINDPTDNDTQFFISLMKSAGLHQHVGSATHKAGNILDHVYTEEGGDIDIVMCETMDYISDHCIVKCVMNVPKENIVRKTITYRKYRQIDVSAFLSDLNFDFTDQDDLLSLVQHFEKSTEEAIEKHAPKRTQTLSVRHRNVWFTEEVHERKRHIRKLEKNMEKNEK